MGDKPKFYISTPIFYPNGIPHIGHAYTAIATDVLARFQRLAGKEVLFATGTDEHGLKMQQTAEELGITPQELADKNSAVFRAMEDHLNCSYDDFIRTTEPRNHVASQETWQRREANGDIYLGQYSGWYSVRQEAYFEEDETDLGEDGVRREPLGSPVEWTEEESYFFKLSAYQDRLLEWYEAEPDCVGPSQRRNEVLSFVKGGLRDISISRTTFDWGIKVPGSDNHVMYVWLDALTNYITGAGFPDEDGEKWNYWPADVHIVGKDIVHFHAVYWPAFLMSAGLATPKRVFAHGFLFNRGEKMSKSVGNVVDPFVLADTYGVDQMRFFFLREIPFGNDGNYNHEAIVNRINSDLANDLGNLAQRSLSMIFKNLNGKVGTPGEFSAEDLELLASVDGLLGGLKAAMDKQQIHLMLNAIWTVVGDANRYFAGEAPWALKTSDPERMATVLYVTAEVIRQVAILVQPVMPGSAAKFLDMLDIPADARDFSALGEAGRLSFETVIAKPVAVFPRYVETDE